MSRVFGDVPERPARWREGWGVDDWWRYAQTLEQSNGLFDAAWREAEARAAAAESEMLELRKALSIAERKLVKAAKREAKRARKAAPEIVLLKKEGEA